MLIQLGNDRNANMKQPQSHKLPGGHFHFRISFIRYSELGKERSLMGDDGKNLAKISKFLKNMELSIVTQCDKGLSRRNAAKQSTEGQDV